jgi:hypothetical protein
MKFVEDKTNKDITGKTYSDKDSDVHEMLLCPTILSHVLLTAIIRIE